MVIDPKTLEKIRLSQLKSWEENKGVFPMYAPKPNSVAQSAGRRHLRSLGARLFQRRSSED